MAYAQNEVYGTILVFEERRFQDFTSEILTMVTLLGGKVQFSVYSHVVCSINVPEECELCFYFKYLRS